ncbi:MAG: SRPBCC domain-containing protein [Chloroflexi bacterium]|nr:SRPBCC domain-containing protein [Chloroflexota bacterium]
MSNTSYRSAHGRVLRHEGLIQAGQAEVWQTLTTTEGLRKFVAPVVRLDFRVGGEWEASYNPAAQIGDPANIVNEVLCYLPMEMLAIRIKRTPPGFPNARVGLGLWTVMQLRLVGERQTHFTLSMLGWPDEPEAEAVYALFERGNAYTLAQLQKVFAAARAGSG